MVLNVHRPGGMEARGYGGVGRGRYNYRLIVCPEYLSVPFSFLRGLFCSPLDLKNFVFPSISLGLSIV